MNDQEWSETVLRDGLGRIAEWCTPSVPGASSAARTPSLRAPIAPAAAAGPRWPRVWSAAAAIVAFGVAGLVWSTAARDSGVPSDPPVSATQPPETSAVTTVVR